MNKKNRLPIKWMLGIIILLVAILYGTNQASRNMAGPAGSSISSQNNFFQFLANMMGWGNPSTSSSSREAAERNNIANQNHSISGQAGDINAGNQQNLNSMTTAGTPSSQGPNASQQKNNAENKPGDTLGTGADQESGDLSESNAQTNSELNAENSPGDNSETNADQNSSENNTDNSTQNNSADNSSNNMQNNSENNYGDNSGNDLGTNSGTNSGNNPGDNSGSNSGSGPGTNSGNTPGYISQDNLPTINPVPSDDTVSQSIAKQDQQSDALAALVAAHQAIVVPAQQQAESAKYQTVSSQSIPAPSTNQAPDGVVQKIKSGQIFYH